MENDNGDSCSSFRKKCPGGGMVDTVDSKSAARKGVRVQVPPGVRKDFADNSKRVKCKILFLFVPQKLVINWSYSF